MSTYSEDIKYELYDYDSIDNEEGIAVFVNDEDDYMIVKGYDPKEKCFESVLGHVDAASLVGTFLLTYYMEEADMNLIRKLKEAGCKCPDFIKKKYPDKVW